MVLPTRRTWFAFWRPLHWPRGLRRLSLLTFPISVLMWLAFGLLMLAASILGELGRALRKFWVAPRRRRISYGYYSYQAPSKPRARSRLRPPPDAAEFVPAE